MATYSWINNSGVRVAILSEHYAFHTSGSANLDTYDSTKLFIKNHLIGIEEDEEIRLIFDNDKFPDTIRSIPGYKTIDPSNNMVIFDSINEKVENVDVLSIMNNVKTMMKTFPNLEKQPVEFYEELMGHLLNVGTPYSSFIEIMLANMFLSDSKEKEFWRYNPDKKAVRKFGDKNLANNLSPTLGCLFQPNNRTIKDVTFDDNSEKMTIYEKIWHEMLD